MGSLGLRRADMMGEGKRGVTQSTNQLFIWFAHEIAAGGPEFEKLTDKDTTMDFECNYCATRCSTSQGLRSHLAQSKACRKKHFEEFAAESSSDSESDGADDDKLLEVHAGHSEPADGDIAMNFLGDSELGAPSNIGSDEEDYEDFDPPSPPPEVPAPAGIASRPADAENAKKRPRPPATIEEVEDEDDRWFQPFNEDRNVPDPGAKGAECKTEFERLREEQVKAGKAPWHPFASKEEWELARWLMTSGVSGTKRDEFFKLKKVRKKLPRSRSSLNERAAG